MINTGYLFSTEKERLFINTSLGCTANCAYCYLPTLKYSKGKKLDNYVTAEKILKDLGNYKELEFGRDGTLISFGCYSECWDERNKKETIKLIKYFLEKGNKIQLSTKKYIDYKELTDISKLIKFYGQLTIFISSATISYSDVLENNTTPPEERFKSFLITKELNIPTILYIKPVLYNITIKDIDLYKEVIKKYNIKDVVVGSIIKTNGKGEVAPFVNDNSMHAEPIEQEKEIISSLKEVCNVYTKSLQVVGKY
ncbi:radical SAM protein [Holdemanella sp. SCCA2]|nr:radical SAM protein [Holdemanella sp. SCCA2]